MVKGRIDMRGFNRRYAISCGVMIWVLLVLFACGDIAMRGTVDDLTTQDPEWKYMDKISAPDGADNIDFGRTVSVSDAKYGTFIIVGDDGYSGWDGRVYIYRLDKDTDEWKADGTLNPTASGTGKAFGHSVDIWQDKAVVGEPAAGASNHGAVYIYDRGSGNWVEDGKINGAEDDDRLGWSVAVTSDKVIAGAPYYTGGFVNQGRVIIYEKNGIWAEDDFVIANDGDTSSDQFGSSVDIYKDLIIVGAPYHNGTNNDEGKVYIFEENAGTWNKQTLPAFTSLTLKNYFGKTVSIFGDYGFGGAPGGNAFTGIYFNQGGSWSKSQLKAMGDSFGSGVGVSQDYAIVGAEAEDGNRGVAYIYAREDSKWSLYQDPLEAKDRKADDFFGCAVAISGDYLVIGARDQGADDEGAIYVYQLKTYD
jgi:hypothetical protein